MIKRKVINRFRATSFGVWNCDRPVAPDSYQVKGKFKDQNGKVYNNHTGYLVDRSRNTVSQFYATKGTNMSFNANSENLLWIVTEDNKIAVFRPEDFKKLNKSKGDFTFNLTLVDKPIDNEEDVRENS